MRRRLAHQIVVSIALAAESEGIENKPRARSLHAAECLGHHRRQCMGGEGASRNDLFGILTNNKLDRDDLWDERCGRHSNPPRWAWRCQVPCHPNRPNTRDRRAGCLACVMSRSNHFLAMMSQAYT